MKRHYTFRFESDTTGPIGRLPLGHATSAWLSYEREYPSAASPSTLSLSILGETTPLAIPVALSGSPTIPTTGALTAELDVSPYAILIPNVATAEANHDGLIRITLEFPET